MDATERPARSPLALLRGYLVARLMLLLNRQQDVLELLDVHPRASVLEVGYGPGELIRLLRQVPEVRVCGVDPSPQMRKMALRRNPGADLRLGTAERTGFADAEFDRVASVNNVALWPHVGTGLRELHRVTRQGALVLLAWHGGKRRSVVARRYALPADKLDRIEEELGTLFTAVTRHELDDLTVFTARRSGQGR